MNLNTVKKTLTKGIKQKWRRHFSSYESWMNLLTFWCPRCKQSTRKTLTYAHSHTHTYASSITVRFCRPSCSLLLFSTCLCWSKHSQTMYTVPCRPPTLPLAVSNFMDFASALYHIWCGPSYNNICIPGVPCLDRMSDRLSDFQLRVIFAYHLVMSE